MKLTFSVLTLAAVLLAGACAPTFNVTLGKMPDRQPDQVIKVGATTKAEIIQLFGKPDFTGIDKDGLEEWTWTHMDVEATPGKNAAITSFFNLDVSFVNDKVRSYSYRKKAE